MFSNRVGEPFKDFSRAWEGARERAKLPGLWFHDLRGEYASRLVEKGVPLSQVRDLLGHASIVTTERYDRQRFETLQAAAKRLDTGEGFKILSSSVNEAIDTPLPSDTDPAEKSLSIN